MTQQMQRRHSTQDDANQHNGAQHGARYNTHTAQHNATQHMSQLKHNGRRQENDTSQYNAQYQNVMQHIMTWHNKHNTGPHSPYATTQRNMAPPQQNTHKPHHNSPQHNTPISSRTQKNTLEVSRHKTTQPNMLFERWSDSSPIRLRVDFERNQEWHFQGQFSPNTEATPIHSSSLPSESGRRIPGHPDAILSCKNHKGFIPQNKLLFKS